MSDTTSLSLRTLVSTVAKIEDLMLANGGELTPEMEAELAVTDVHLPVKIDNYHGILERLELAEAFFEKKAKDMAQVAKSYNTAYGRLRQNLKDAMATAKTNELKGNDYRFRLVDNAPAIFIENEDLVPAAYKTIIPESYKIDKKRVGEDLKLGVPVDGCRLDQGQTLRKYVNTARSR